MRRSESSTGLSKHFDRMATFLHSKSKKMVKRTKNRMERRKVKARARAKTVKVVRKAADV